jgi:hypothetical protein
MKNISREQIVIEIESEKRSIAYLGQWLRHAESEEDFAKMIEILDDIRKSTLRALELKMRL